MGLTESSTNFGFLAEHDPTFLKFAHSIDLLAAVLGLDGVNA